MNHQVAVQLPAAAHETLKRLAKAQGKPYAAIIAQALTALDSTSDLLAPASGDLTVYAMQTIETRQRWKATALELRRQGQSYSKIGKTLFTQFGLTAIDGLPLSPGTIRGMCAE